MYVIGKIMTKKLNLKTATIKELKDFINSIPDNAEFSIYESGRSGYVNEVEFEYNEYSEFNDTLDLNIEAESGYVY